MRTNAGCVSYAFDRTELEERLSRATKTDETLPRPKEPRCNIGIRSQRESFDEWSQRHARDLDKITAHFLAALKALWVRGHTVDVRDVDAFVNDVREYCYLTFGHHI